MQLQTTFSFHLLVTMSGPGLLQVFQRTFGGGCWHEFFYRLSCQPTECLRFRYTVVQCSDVVWDRLLGQDRSETKKIGLGLGLPHCGLGLAGLMLWNTVLSRSSSSWSWRTQQLFKYYL